MKLLYFIFSILVIFVLNLVEGYTNDLSTNVDHKKSKYEPLTKVILIFK